MGIAYAALASVHALVTVGRPTFLFDEQADHLPPCSRSRRLRSRSSPAGLSSRPRTSPAPRTGCSRSWPVFARLSRTRDRGSARRRPSSDPPWRRSQRRSRSSPPLSSGGTCWRPRWRRRWAPFSLGLAGRLRTDGLAAAAYAWLGVVLVVALTYELGHFYDDETGLSTGGWAVLAAGAGLLGGGVRVPRRLVRDAAPDAVFGVGAGVAALAAALGVGFLTSDVRPGGLGLLGVAVVYVVLAAAIFPREAYRNASTVLWSLSLAFLVGAESLLVTDSVWRTVVVAATALAVGALAAPLRESRLWLAGGLLGVGTSVVVSSARPSPGSGRGRSSSAWRSPRRPSRSRCSASPRSPGATRSGATSRRCSGRTGSSSCSRPSASSSTTGGPRPFAVALTGGAIGASLATAAREQTVAGRRHRHRRRHGRHDRGVHPDRALLRGVGPACGRGLGARRPASRGWPPSCGRLPTRPTGPSSGRSQVASLCTRCRSGSSGSRRRSPRPRSRPTSSEATRR